MYFILESILAMFPLHQAQYHSKIFPRLVTLQQRYTCENCYILTLQCVKLSSCVSTYCTKIHMCHVFTLTKWHLHRFKFMQFYNLHDYFICVYCTYNVIHSWQKGVMVLSLVSNHKNFPMKNFQLHSTVQWESLTN